MSPSVSVRLLLTQSDARLVALARAGHERAFEALVERYRRPLLGYCRRLLLPHERAEDALQQGLLQAWLALREGTEVRDVKPWLYRIVHNAALNIRRSGYDYAQLSETLSGAGAPPEDLDRRIAVREALAGLAALPEMQREALLRTAVDGCSYQEAAAMLGMSEGAVRGLVHRARVALRTATTALTPAPLLSWALNSGSADAPLAGRLAAGAGGGSAGLLAGLLKVTATAVTAGVVAGGIAVPRDRHDAGHHTNRATPAVSLETAGGAGGHELTPGGSRARETPDAVPSQPGSPSPRSPTFTAQRRGRRDLQAGHTPRRRHWTLSPVSQPAAPQLALPPSHAEVPAARAGDGGGNRQPGEGGGDSGSELGNDSERRQGSGAGDGGATEGEHSSSTASPDRHETSEGGHDGSSESGSSRSSSGNGQSEDSQGPTKPDGHSQGSSNGSGERQRATSDQGPGTTPSLTGEGGATNPDSSAAASGESGSSNVGGD